MLTKLTPSVVINNVEYNYGSTLLTVGAFAAGTNGQYAITATAADGSSNTATLTPAASTAVDNIRTNPTDLSIANGGGGVAGRPNTGDVVTIGWLDPIDPRSVVAGWTGAAATEVTVRVVNGNPDTMTFWNRDNTAQLPLGTLSLGTAYCTGNVTYGAAGTRSTMTWGSDLNGFAGFTLGTASVNGNVATVPAGTTSAVTWASPNTVWDRSGNYANAVAAFAEPGAADRDF